MTRKRRVAPAGFRFCNRCEAMHPATPEFFVADKSRPLGIAYECRPCLSMRKKGRDRRAERWSNMTPSQKSRNIALAAAYRKTGYGRALFLRKAYQRIDECDFSTSELAAFIEQPCFYCGSTEEPRGLDRIDNSGAHTKENVVPACVHCNFARGNRLTMEEMRRVGATIAAVLRDRRPKEVDSEVHP